MPEFLPTPQLPTGLAEETLRLAAQQGAANPWAALAQAVGTATQGLAEGARYRSQRGPILSPEQLDALGILPPTRAPGPALPGKPPPTMTPSAKTVFPQGAPMSLAENLLQRRVQLEKQQQVADLAGQKLEIPITDTTRALFKKAKMPLDPNATTVRHEEYEAAVKAAAGLGGGTNMGIKDLQFKDKRMTQLGEALDFSKQRAGAGATSKLAFDRAERLESLASAYKDGNLDSRQIEELAIGMNSMLSGAQTGAEAQVRALVPKTYRGDAQKIKEWLTNEPQGTQQQKFVERMLGSISREKATAADQMKRTRFQRISQYSDVEKNNPQEWENLLQSYEVDPAEYRAWKKGGHKKMSAVQGAEGAKGGGDALDALIDKHLGGP